MRCLLVTTVLFVLSALAAAAEPPAEHITVDVDALKFSGERRHLFRSSVFYNAATDTSRRLYVEAFPDHHAARIWGLFETESWRSRDLDSFRKLLNARREEIEALSRRHRKLIVMIAMMPPWLSVSDDDRLILGRWRRLHAHGPTDYRKWEQIVTAAAEFFRQFDVERYYEIWNEPDLEYWQEGVDAFLRLYAHTARSIRAIDREGRIGGAAANGWQGKVRASPERDPVNLELIRFARRRDLPLDFVSWHHYGTGQEPVIAEARAGYERACRDAGYARMPEWIVSEWHLMPADRDAPMAAAMLADAMLGLYEAGVDVQTICAWADFHPSPHREGYGLVTFEGQRKPAFHLHRFFDEIGRQPDGIAIVRHGPDDPLARRTRLIVARAGDRRLSILVWTSGFDAATGAAIRHLKQRGVVERFGSMVELIEAVRTGRPRSRRYRKLFDDAAAIYREKSADLIPRRRATIDLGNAVKVTKGTAKAIANAVVEKPIDVNAAQVSFDLGMYEVVKIELEIERVASNE